MKLAIQLLTENARISKFGAERNDQKREFGHLGNGRHTEHNHPISTLLSNTP